MEPRRRIHFQAICGPRAADPTPTASRPLIAPVRSRKRPWLTRWECLWGASPISSPGQVPMGAWSLPTSPNRRQGHNGPHGIVSSPECSPYSGHGNSGLYHLILLSA